MWVGYIITSLIVSLLTALVVSAAWIRITRRYARLSHTRHFEQMQLLKKKESIISEKTLALRELFFQVHHRGPRPAMASALGLLDLYNRESKELGENLQLLAKPNHHAYASLSIKYKARMDDYIKKVETICIELHKNSVASVERFEHLQE